MKSVLDSLEGVDEALHSEYEERDGAFHLKVEGAAPRGYATGEDYATARGKVDKFRTSYTDLLKGVAQIAGVEEAEDLEPVKAMLAKYAGVDLELFETLKTKAADLKKKTGVTKAEDIAAMIKEGVQLGIKPFQDKFEAAEAARVAAQESADNALLRERISDKALEAGAQPGAISFLLGEAASTFEVVDNEVVARAGKFSAQDAGEPISVDEWITGAASTHAFAFGASSGAAADKSRETTNLNIKQLVNPTADQLGDPKIAAAVREGKLKLVTQATR